MLTLFCVGGLPGSGKSTLARELCQEVCEADDWFVWPDGSYRFDPSELKAAHEDCQYGADCLLRMGVSVAVANTFSQRWELEPYIAMAEKHGARLVVIDLFDAGLTDEELAARNVHGVPLHVITAMRNRWHHDWRNGR